MRITYVYHEYRDRRRRYADEMSALNHEVTLLHVPNKKTAGQITYQLIKDTNPDIVFLLSPFYISHKVITDESLEWLRANKIKLVCYGTLNTQVPFNLMDRTWKTFDVFFAQQRELTTYLRSIGVNAHYVPLGFYPDQYPKTISPKTIDISFMGNPQTTVEHRDKRVEYIKALRGYDIKVYGKAFNQKGILAEAYGDHKSQVDIYSKSKINLDLPFINSGDRYYDKMLHLKNRFFEVPATGNFLLTARCKEFTDILDENMVGYYDDNINSLKAMVHKYLGDDDLREKMAEKAYNEVINNHTFSHRFKQIFDILEQC